MKVFTTFLRRLIKQAKRKVFLIVDGHPVHRAKLIQAWRAKHSSELELFYVPGYSPELNPDEMLNNDVKTNALGRRRPRHKTEMVVNLRSYLRGTQRRPDIVRSYPPRSPCPLRRMIHQLQPYYRLISICTRVPRRSVPFPSGSDSQPEASSLPTWPIRSDGLFSTGSSAICSWRTLAVRVCRPVWWLGCTT